MEIIKVAFMWLFLISLGIFMVEILIFIGCAMYKDIKRR